MEKRRLKIRPDRVGRGDRTGWIAIVGNRSEKSGETLLGEECESLETLEAEIDGLERELKDLRREARALFAKIETK
jgi:hypothetical protein